MANRRSVKAGKPKLPPARKAQIKKRFTAEKKKARQPQIKTSKRHAQGRLIPAQWHLLARIASGGEQSANLGSVASGMTGVMFFTEHRG